MTLTYIAELGFIIWNTDVDTHKIDCSALMLYEIVIAYIL